MKALVCLLPFSIGKANEFSPKEVNITIYNDGSCLIKENRGVKLEKGESTISLNDIPEYIDPLSIVYKFPGEVREQRFNYSCADMSELLKKSINRIVSVSANDKNYSGKLVSLFNGQIVLETKTSDLIIVPNINEFRVLIDSIPNGYYTKPALEWVVNVSKPGYYEIPISYLSKGVKWSADYIAVLNESESKIDLSAWVNINNMSGASFKNAKVALMAGEIHRLGILNGGDGFTIRAKDDNILHPPTFLERPFFDYHIYELDQAATLLNNETKQLSLFSVKQIPIKKSFKSVIELGYNFNVENVNSPVNVYIEFANSVINNLGIPFPKGAFSTKKAFKNSEALLGFDNIGHTAKDEIIKVNAGITSAVKIESKVISVRLLNEKKEEKVKENEYIIESRIFNHKDEDIEIDVAQNIFGELVEIQSSEVAFSKDGTYTYSFKIKVYKNSQKTVKYKVVLQNRY